MKKIKHIVYLMLENRSFDNLLGWTYDDAHPPKHNVPPQSPPTYHGLKPETYFNVDDKGQKHFVTRGTASNLNVPVHDPHEEYAHINVQLFGSEATPVAPKPPEKPPEPTMVGFYKDFATYGSHTEQILQSYTPEELPVINGLAHCYAVSDCYFASVPTQTNCNRAFSHSGNSLGENDKGVLESWVNNRGFDFVPPHLGQPEGRQFDQKTLWNVLDECGMGQSSDWMHYYSHGTHLEDWLGAEGYAYTRDLMKQLQGKHLDHHFDKIDTFFDRAKAGTLPTVSFLEPDWGLEALLFGHDLGINGNDYHPPTNLAAGEAFLKKIYDALTSNEQAFQQTLFIINFDEHGGTYDHVPPPWGAATPWSNGETPAPECAEGDFKFDRFGVRVPLILVSPWVEECTVFRAAGATPFDHTSAIATILTLLGVPKDKWGLGGRTASAPTFEHLLSRDTPRADLAPLKLHAGATRTPAAVADATENAPANDIQKRMAQALLSRVIRQRGLSNDAVTALSLSPLHDTTTQAELATRLKDAIERVGQS